MKHIVQIFALILMLTSAAHAEDIWIFHLGSALVVKCLTCNEAQVRNALEAVLEARGDEYAKKRMSGLVKLSFVGRSSFSFPSFFYFGNAEDDEPLTRELRQGLEALENAAPEKDKN